MRVLTVLAGGALAACLLAAASALASTDPDVEAVATLTETIDTSDIDAAVALFTDDAIVIQPRVGGMPEVYVGQDQIRWWLRSLSAEHARFEITGSPRQSGNQVRWWQTFAVDAFRQLGIDRLIVESDATFTDEGRIATLRTVLTPAAARNLLGVD